MRRRVVIALAAYGADQAEIAAALDIDDEQVVSLFAEQVEVGQLLLAANVIAQLMRRATADGSSWSLGAAKWLLRRNGWDDRPRRQQRTTRAA